MWPTTRTEEWSLFEGEVWDHIHKYAVPQYGEKGEDQLTDYTPHDIEKQLLRYVNRIGTDQRGEDNALMDCLKIAHYACVLWFKYQEAPDDNASVLGE